MTQEVGRRLIDGVWETNVEAQGDGGGGGGTPAGDDGQIQFNDDGAFGASADLTFASASPGDPRSFAVVAGSSASGDDGGSVTLTAGDANDINNGDGGDVDISSGFSAGGNGGDINIRGNPPASAGFRGGDINIRAGQGDSNGGNLSLQGGAANGSTSVISGDGNQSLQVDSTGLNFVGPKIAFFGNVAPAEQPTGVAVTVEAIHAALVTLGLITA